jgi:hypothetical protein
LTGVLRMRKSGGEILGPLAALKSSFRLFSLLRVFRNPFEEPPRLLSHSCGVIDGRNESLAAPQVGAKRF